MKTAVLLLALLLWPSTIQAQRVRAAGQHQVNQAEIQFGKSVPPPVHLPQAADPTRLRQDADELATLAESVPSAVDQTTKGILPKDLEQKLKRIEKLAKQLRSQIVH